MQVSDFKESSVGSVTSLVSLFIDLQHSGVKQKVYFIEVNTYTWEKFTASAKTSRQ